MFLHLSMILFGGGVSVQGDFWLGVSLSRGLCLGGLSQGDPHMVMSGQYASCWNAFLFKFEFLEKLSDYISFFKINIIKITIFLFFHLN